MRYQPSKLCVLDSLEAALEVIDDVGDVLDANGQADGRMGDTSTSQAGRVGLGMRSGGWVHHQGTYIADIR